MLHKKTTPNYLKFILIALAIILLSYIAVIAYFSLLNNNDTAAINGGLGQSLVSQNLITILKNNTPQISADSPVLGKENAPIVIFEYASFDCAYSAQSQSTIKEILNQYPAEIKLIWKDLPANEKTMPAHQAARCAGEQGKFWEYADWLWQNQKDLSLENLKKLAQDLKLNAEEFGQCLNDEKITEAINQNIAEAERLMIENTPHFYINSQELMGLATFENLKKMIEAEKLRNL